MRFAYEWHDDSGHWFRSYGNENWEFDEHGLMRLRIASINDLPIRESERKFTGRSAVAPTVTPGSRSSVFKECEPCRRFEDPGLPGPREQKKNSMARAFAEIAFTPAVRAVQERLGSAAAYCRASHARGRAR